MKLHSQWVSICFVIEVNRQEYSNLWKIVIFQYFQPLGSFSPSFSAGEGVNYIKITWNDKSAICSCVRNEFQFPLWSRSAGRSTQTYKKWTFSNIFSLLGLFSQVFGQVKECDFLELNKMIRISHLVASPMVFNLICHLSRQTGVVKLTNNAQF